MMRKLILSAAAFLALTSSVQANDLTNGSIEPNIAAAREAVSHYLSAWVGQYVSRENMRDIFSDEAAVELEVTSRPHWSLRIEGRAAIGEFIEEASQAGSSWSFTDLAIYPTMNPNVVFAQFSSSALIGGRKIAQSNLLVIELDGNRIANLKDLNGSPAVMEALLNSRRLAAQPTGDAPGQ